MQLTRLTVIALLACVGISRTISAQEQAGSSRSANEAQVLAAERAIWDAIKNNQWSVFDRAIAGMTYVDPSGIVVWKPGNPKQFEGIVTKSYSLESVQLRTLAPDMILLTYKATLDQTADGKPVPSPIYMLSLWQRRGSEWRPVAHSETPAAAPNGR